MTYLEIVQRAWRLVPMNGVEPTSIATPTSLSQEGRVLLDMINDAWTTLKNEREDWKFFRESINFNTQADKQLYTTSDLTVNNAKIADIVRWDRNGFRFQQKSDADDIGLTCIHEGDFEKLYTRSGPYNVDKGHPSVITVLEDDSRTLRVYPVPDGAYTVYGRFWYTSGEFSADADTPDLPDDFHMMLVWKGVWAMGEHMGKEQAIRMGSQNYNKYHIDLVQNQTQRISLAHQPLVY